MLAEVYSPGNGTWTLAGSLATGRSAQTATLLLDGRVLVAAGYGEETTSPAAIPEFRDHGSLASSELGFRTS